MWRALFELKSKALLKETCDVSMFNSPVLCPIVHRDEDSWSLLYFVVRWLFLFPQLALLGDLANRLISPGLNIAHCKLLKIKKKGTLTSDMKFRQEVYLLTHLKKNTSIIKWSDRSLWSLRVELDKLPCRWSTSKTMWCFVGSGILNEPG